MAFLNRQRTVAIDFAKGEILNSPVEASPTSAASPRCFSADICPTGVLTAFLSARQHEKPPFCMDRQFFLGIVSFGFQIAEVRKATTG